MSAEAMTMPPEQDASPVNRHEDEQATAEQIRRAGGRLGSLAGQLTREHGLVGLGDITHGSRPVGKGELLEVTTVAPGDSDEVYPHHDQRYRMARSQNGDIGLSGPTIVDRGRLERSEVRVTGDNVYHDIHGNSERAYDFSNANMSEADRIKLARQEAAKQLSHTRSEISKQRAKNEAERGF